MSGGDSPSHPIKLLPRWHVAILCALLVMAGALRVHRLAVQSFGFDELFSVHFASARGAWETALPTGAWLDPAPDVQSMHSAPPWWRIWTSMGYDTHPPLYPMILRGWIGLFGESDGAARSLSVACSLAMMLLLFDAVRTLAGSTAGLWAAAIAAVAGPQIEYSQECRSYMMLTMLSAGALAAATRMLVSGATTRRCAIFACVAVVMMLTHYWAIGMLLPLAGVLILLLKPPERKWLVAACSIAAIGYIAAWGPFLFQQRQNFSANMDWIADHDPSLILRSMRRAAIVPLRLLFAPPAPMIDQVAVGTGVSWLLAAAVGVLLPVLALRSDRRTILFAAGFLGPIVLVAIADTLAQRQTLNLIRYTLPASVGLYALLATALSRNRRAWLAHVVPAIAVLGCLGALPTAWDRTRPPLRELATRAMVGTESTDVLVVLGDPKRAWIGPIMYMAMCRYTDRLPGPAVLLDRPAENAMLARLAAARRIAVLSDQPEPRIEEFLPGAVRLPQNGWLPEAGSYAHVTFRPREKE